MKKIATIVGAALIAATAVVGAAPASATIAFPTAVVHCPAGSYAIVVKPGPHGPIWGCTKSVWEQGHHRRHHHP